MQICVWHESFPAAEDSRGRKYDGCRRSARCHHRSTLNCRLIHTDGSVRINRNGRDGPRTDCVLHPVRRLNSAVLPREYRRADGARLCPVVQLTPPSVAENARTREWTQGTSGVGHGEHAMATSETRGGPETARNHEHEPRVLVARRDANPRGSDDIGRTRHPNRILLLQPTPDCVHESSSCRQQEPANPTRSASPR